MTGYGKHFESMYGGSMRGAGFAVYAVWGWVFSHARDGLVEINPQRLADELGGSVAAVEKAIAYLCSPDPRSRTKDEDGRRLVREGEFLYRVVTHHKYREMKGNVQDYERDRKRDQRDRIDALSRTALDNTGRTGTSASEDASESASVSVSDAFAAGWDGRAVARLFGDERKRAGKGGRYSLSMKHFDAAQSALQWSLDEGETVDGAREATRRSVQAFLRERSEFITEAGYTFPHWASDPGKWLMQSSGRGSPSHAQQERDARMQAEMTRAREAPPENILQSVRKQHAAGAA